MLLRGTVDAGDYKQFIFPLLFYKRLCDVFDEETQLALKESGGDIEFAAYPENHRFQIPEECHWQEVRKSAKNVGSALQSAMRGIETANPEKLYGIFGDAQWTNKERLSDAMLRDLIEHFSALDLSIANLPEDELGQGYEYLIKKFADDSGHTAAEFYTNRTVVHLMTEMLEPQPGESIYDPTCGSGGMLLSCISHLRRHKQEWRNAHLYGQERNLMTSSIARMNCFLHGIEDFQIVRGDTLADPKFVKGDRLMQFDVVLANPPYSIKQWDREAFSSDAWGRNRYGTPPQGRADYAFWQHILCSLRTKTGRCAILFPHGVLFRQEEADMRRKLIDADVIECVLGLGSNLFYNSPMEACVVICRSAKPKPRKGRILFINAVNEVTRERAQSFLTDEHIERVVAAYREFQTEPGFARVASLEEVRKQGGSLNIPMYVTGSEHASGTKAVSNSGSLAESLSSWLGSSVTVREQLNGLLEKKLPSKPLPTSSAIASSLPAWLKRNQWIRLPFGGFADSIGERVEPADAAEEVYVGLDDLDSGSLHIRRWGKGSDVIGTKLRFRKGDIIFGRRRAYQRKLAVAEVDGICSAHAMVVRAKAAVVLPEFLPFLMMSDRFMNRAVEISVGSLSPTINWTALKSEEFNLPPLDQQRRVAEILWALDEAQQAYIETLRAAASLRRTRMQECFSRHNYPTVTIGESGDVQLGRQRSPKYQTGAFTKPYLRVANVFDGFIDYGDVLEMDFDERDFKTYRLCPGDILLNEGQSRELVGRCAVYDAKLPECCFQNTLIRYRAGDKVLRDYAMAFFQHCFHTGVFASISSQTTSIAHLGLERFAKLPIPVPPKQEQRKIVQAYADIRKAESAISDHLSQMNELRSSLLSAVVL